MELKKAGCLVCVFRRDDAKNKGRERMNDLPLGRADSSSECVEREQMGRFKKKGQSRGSRARVEREEEGEQA